MRAWRQLIAGSTLTSGNAWAHLSAQGGGGSDVVYVERIDAMISDVVLAGAVSEDAIAANILLETISASVMSETVAGNVAVASLSGSGADVTISGSVANLELSGNFLEEFI